MRIQLRLQLNLQPVNCTGRQNPGMQPWLSSPRRTQIAPLSENVERGAGNGERTKFPLRAMSLHRPCEVSLDLTLADRRAFVVEFFSTGQGQLDFRTAFLEI